MDVERWLEQNSWLIALCVTLPFGLVGVYLIYMGSSARRLVKSSQNWAVAVGRIVESGIEVKRRRASVSRTRTNITYYYPQVIYEYEVNGHLYRGRTLAIAHRVGYGTEGEAQEQAGQYPVGATVQVYYNPQDPAQTALQPGAPFNWLLASVGIGLVLLFIVVMVTVGNPSFTSGLPK